jgi:hypothetical protein
MCLIVSDGDALPGVAEEDWLIYHDEERPGVPESHFGRRHDADVPDRLMAVAEQIIEAGLASVEDARAWLKKIGLSITTRSVPGFLTNGSAPCASFALRRPRGEVPFENLRGYLKSR